MADDKQARELFGEVLAAQQKLALARMQAEEAKAERDQAIINAAAAGFPRRALAQASNLTAGRVQQIVDEAQARPDLQPALRMERDRRQRSQQLADLARRYADGELA